MNNLSIVLSTYNEIKNIELVLNHLVHKKIVKDIIVIDDNSSDGTIDILKNFKSSKLTYIIRKDIRGFASAFIHGIRLATGDHILRFDLDMYNNIDLFLKTYEEKKNDHDCIIFSRYIVGGLDKRSFYRSFSSLLINKLCQIFLFSKIKDYTSCIIIFKKQVLVEVFPKNTYYANFIIDFIFELLQKNKNVKEIAFTQDKYTEENSKSAPNMIKFFFNGLLYLFSILRCSFIKLLRIK